MAPPKKDDPFAPKPNKFLPFVAAGLLLLGGGWFIHQLNPGGILRAETAEEKKARLDHEREIMMKEREKANKEKEMQTRMKRIKR
jgi:hypothetical protein